MKNVLISWVGLKNVDGTGRRIVNLADIERVLCWKEIRFEKYVAFYDSGHRTVEEELNSVLNKWGGDFTSVPVKLIDPNSHEEIFKHCEEGLKKQSKYLDGYVKYFYITPGTATMHAVWLFLAKTRFSPSKLIHAPREQLPKEIEVPFDIAIEYIPGVIYKKDSELITLDTDATDTHSSFKQIIGRSPAMREIVGWAKILSRRAMPVLLEGESGTGKSHLARTIHDAGPRRDKPFIQMNCGGLAESLIESELFGVATKVATDVNERSGYFEQANGGTIFLDEIGELPLTMQTRLLKVLEDNCIVKVGSTKPIDIDVRVIAATNKNLIHEVQKGRFRDDLFYRLAGMILTMPSLASRRGDLKLLIDYFLDRINSEEAKNDSKFVRRQISARAYNKLLHHDWPGNVRELNFTLRRAILLFSSDSIIKEIDIERSMLQGIRKKDINTVEVEDGLNLEQYIEHITANIIQKSLNFTGGNKTKAAELLCLDRSKFTRLYNKMIRK